MHRIDWSPIEAASLCLPELWLKNCRDQFYMSTQTHFREELGCLSQ